MAEKQNQPFQLSFNSSLKVNFQGSRVTSDGGLILVREGDATFWIKTMATGFILNRTLEFKMEIPVNNDSSGCPPLQARRNAHARLVLTAFGRRLCYAASFC